MRPRSSTRVLSPFSVSSFAAQPPLIPEPTTIASNEFVSMLYFNPPYHGPRRFGGFFRRGACARKNIMDSLRVLLVPFHPTNLLMVGVFAVLLSFCLWGGFYGWFAAWFLQIWVF